MDLKELRYFRAIAEFENFSKAAVALRVAQPALSRQMRKLEHSLGVELLRRTSRGVTPTPAGEALLRRTIMLESDLEETRREVSAYSDNVVGTLRIAVAYPLGLLMVPDLVRAYRERYPGVGLNIVDGYSGDIVDGLLEKRIDIAIVTPPRHGHAEMTMLPLWTSPLKLIGPARAAHEPPFDADVVPLSEVAKLPLIVPSQSSMLRQVIDATFARRQLRVEPYIEADGPLLIFEMVKAGLGYSLFAYASFAPYEQAGDLVSRDTSPVIRRTMAILTRTSLLNERAVRHFTDMTKVAAAKLLTTDRFLSSKAYADATADQLSGFPDMTEPTSGS